MIRVSQFLVRGLRCYDQLKVETVFMALVCKHTFWASRRSAMAVFLMTISLPLYGPFELHASHVDLT
jgi:hypothetical protein